MSVGSNAVQVGDTFNIAISIGDVAAENGLTSWQFDLRFDPTIVSAALVTEGDFLSSAGQTLFTPGFVDDSAGLISLIADAYVDLPPSPSGSGILATITFTALADGASALTLENGFLDFVDSGFENKAGSVTVGATSVPEPGSLALVASGLLMAVRLRPRRRA